MKPLLPLRARRAIAAGIVLATFAFTAPAGAAEPTAEEKAGARAAATEGSAAFDAKRYAEALDLFQRAESLVHAPTHLLMIARSQVALGQLVRGRETYNALVREPLAANAPQVFKDAQVEGKKELEALEPRIPTIHVKLSDPAAKGVTVTMDGTPVPPALVGVARPVDPGKHVLAARGDGVSSSETTVEIAEAQRLDVVLELRDDPSARAPVTPPAAGEPAPPPPADDGGSDTMTILGWSGVGLGVAGIGLGAVFVGLGASDRSEADDLADQCTTADPCFAGSPRAQAITELDDDANTKQTIGLIGFIAGGAFAAAGVTMLVLSGGDDAPSDASITPWIGVGSAGARGTF